MEIEYKEGYAYVDGYKFRKNQKSGYYLCSKNIGSSRPDLHRYIWIKYNGEIPKGYEIHHKDMNKENNEISNLEMLTREQHRKWHADNISDELINKFKLNLQENARPKAIEWHKSENGREWHKKNSKKIWENKKEVEVKCKKCSKKFKTKRIKAGYYCSANCRSKARFDSGIDNEVRCCVICESKFSINKYLKTTTCSRQCSGKLIWKNRKERGLK